MLRSDATKGLADDEAELNIRRDAFGSNTYPEKKLKPFWVLLWEATEDTTLRILVVCATIAFIVGMVTEGTQKGWYDGTGIFFAIILVVLIQACNNWQQQRQFRNLNRKKKNIPVQVTRSGRRREVSIYDLCVGEIVHLNLGDQVSADGVLLSSVALICDESSMTGESKPVNKDVQKRPFVISGTKVVEGYGDMLVTAVGLNTEWGRVMAAVTEDNDEQTPLQERLEKVALGIGKLGLTVAVLVFIILVSRFMITDLDYHHFGGDDIQSFVNFFATAVTIVVVAVPEGLPLAVTLSLAYSMKKMMEDKALIRHLSACETMGGATAICSDKTGTLTTNKACYLSRSHRVQFKHTSAVLREAMCVNSNGSVFVPEVGKVEITGKPTECAVLGYAVDLGANFDNERKSASIVQVEPFNSARKRMGVLLKLSDGSHRVHWKGATEALLGQCTKYMQPDGAVAPLGPQKLAELRSLTDAFANESLRTLCLASCDYPAGTSVPFVTVTPAEDGDAEEGDKRTQRLPMEDLTCIAIVGIKDPCRKGVPEAVRRCQAAGVMVRMVTGDYIVTAKAIARECNILTEDGLAMEGPEFRKMPKEQLLELLPRLQVLARSSPTDKQLLVKLLREQGNVVAVTGDGTNDAPALKQADIGLSMGIAGTEIAKESSDIVIMDDNFATVVPVIRWGRSVFENIRKFVQFQLTVNIVALTLNFVSSVILAHAPLTVVQLLWVNLIMDTLGALALGTEPPNEKLMLRKPYGRHEPLFSNVMWRNLTGMVVYQLVVLLVIQFAGYRLFKLVPPNYDAEVVQCWDDTRKLNTIIFNTFVFAQIFNEISSRDMEDSNCFRGLHKNRIFIAWHHLSCPHDSLDNNNNNNNNNNNSVIPNKLLYKRWSLSSSKISPRQHTSAGRSGLPAFCWGLEACVKQIRVPYSPVLQTWLGEKVGRLRQQLSNKPSLAAVSAAKISTSAIVVLKRWSSSIDRLRFSN
eukprot:jgi/Chlat1/5649/Chrsp37S05473